MKRNGFVAVLIIGIIACLCGCAKNELKDHVFSSYRDSIKISFAGDSATLILVDTDTRDKTTVELTYKIDGSNLYLYDAGGIERITATIEEDGKVIHLTRFNGVDKLGFSSNLYRDDAGDIKGAAESSLIKSVDDEIKAQL